MEILRNKLYDVHSVNFTRPIFPYKYTLHMINIKSWKRNSIVIKKWKLTLFTLIPSFCTLSIVDLDSFSFTNKHMALNEKYFYNFRISKNVDSIFIAGILFIWHPTALYINLRNNLNEILFRLQRLWQRHLLVF